MTRPQKLLLAIVLSFPIVGALEAQLPAPTDPFSWLDIAHTLVLLLLLYLWMRADERERGRRKPRGAVVLLIVVAFIGVPYYLLRTRPWREGLIACAKALGLFLLATGLYYVALYVSGWVAGGA